MFTKLISIFKKIIDYFPINPLQKKDRFLITEDNKNLTTENNIPIIK